MAESGLGGDIVQGPMIMASCLLLYTFSVCCRKIRPRTKQTRISANPREKTTKAPSMKDFMTKIFRSKYSVIFLVLFIALLYFLQEKAIVPLVMQVVKSDAFFEKPVEEDEPLGKIQTKTQRTGFALMHCKDAVKEEGDLPDNVEFLDEKYEAWALGNRHYIIRSSVRIIDPEKGQMEKAYACKIRMTGDDEADSKNWEVQGVDFNAMNEGN
jgi:hypothetical protein